MKKKQNTGILIGLLVVMLACSACGKKEKKAGADAQTLLAAPEETVWMDGTPEPAGSEQSDESKSVDPVLQESIQPNEENSVLPEEVEAVAEQNDFSGLGMVSTNNLDVHVAAKGTSEICGSLARGMQVEVVGKTDEWSYVRSQSLEGYVLSEFIRSVDEVVQTETTQILFYDSILQRYADVEKTYYWAQFEGKPRRFDSKLPPQVFSVDGEGNLQVSSKIQEMTKNMARTLYKTTAPRVTCYFGQYYPSGTREDGTVYETGIHEGIDFAGPTMDAEFYSLTDGTVTSMQVGDDHMQYNWIAVYTGSVTVFYIHNTSSFVQVGDAIVKGQRLGTQGDYGSKGAYHVHVEMVNGNAATFNRSKDTELIDDSPYEFWESQGY